MTIKPENIDDILPQTQCGLCGFGGCMPYAKALANENAHIDLCLPGGTETLIKIGDILKKDSKPFEAEMATKTKLPSVAIIIESTCIGCTKCIQVCPVDAIIGTSKKMHTIIKDECTGCELCIPACPVDCIQMIELPDKKLEPKKYKNRFEARNKRLENEKEIKDKNEITNTMNQKKQYILDAISRAKNKKLNLSK